MPGKPFLAMVKRSINQNLIYNMSTVIPDAHKLPISLSCNFKLNSIYRELSRLTRAHLKIWPTSRFSEGEQLRGENTDYFIDELIL